MLKSSDVSRIYTKYSFKTQAPRIFWQIYIPEKTVSVSKTRNLNVYVTALPGVKLSALF